jgi:GTP-binding protein YchF
MSFSVGIVGLPNVGKSTLFKTVTKKQVDCVNYPFCTIEPNIGTVAVLDERIDKLAGLLNLEKKIYPVVKFVDIAGLVKGASQGEGLGNRFLAHIRETEMIVYVLRAFKNSDIINTLGEINPIKEKEILGAELMLKDLETLKKRADDLDGEARAGKKEAIKELEIVKTAINLLERGKLLVEKSWPEENRKVLNQYQLLTMKRRLYLLNAKEEEVGTEVKKTFEDNNWPFLIIDVLSENEAVDLTAEERASLNMPLSGLDLLIKKCYHLLGLITFFTAGEKESRGWTLERGKKAPSAGGVIHSDFEQYFIKAEIINWQELINSGGYSQAREKGLIRTEGREYVVQDGDVIEIKFAK